MRRNQTLLDTLLELQILDRVPRSGYSLRGITAPESVSEHSFHLAFLAWTLAEEEPDLDRARVMELALMHDVAEVRFGDLPRTAAQYLPSGAKASAERAAADEILAPLGDRALELLAEYQDGATPEARFVGACDKLQLLLKVEHYERWGAAGLEELWRRLDDFPDAGFASIQRLAAALKERREERRNAAK